MLSRRCAAAVALLVACSGLAGAASLTQCTSFTSTATTSATTTPIVLVGGTAMVFAQNVDW